MDKKSRFKLERNHQGGRSRMAASHRRAVLSVLSATLVEHEQIVTTLPKAKELRPFVEKLVTLAKKGDLNSRRIAIARMRNKEQAKKLFDVIGPRYADRSGGYIRIRKAGFRPGDNAPMAVIEFTPVDRKQRDPGRPASRSASYSDIDAALDGRLNPDQLSDRDRAVYIDRLTDNLGSLPSLKGVTDYYKSLPAKLKVGSDD